MDNAVKSRTDALISVGLISEEKISMQIFWFWVYAEKFKFLGMDSLVALLFGEISKHTLVAHIGRGGDPEFPQSQYDQQQGGRGE